MGMNASGYAETLSGESRDGATAGMAVRDSAVIVEADSRETRAILFEVVDGAARFISVGSNLTYLNSDSERASQAPTEATSPVEQALRALERETGRRLLEGGSLLIPQRENGDGADAYYLTGVPIEPNRAVLIGVGNGTLSTVISTAVRHTLTVLADAKADLKVLNAGFSSNALANWLRTVMPTTVILVNEGGAPEDWEITIEAVAEVSRDGAMVQGIVVGDETSQQQVARVLGNTLELSGIDPAEYERSEIALALETEFRDQYERRINDASTFKLLGNARFLDRMQASESVAAFMHRRMRRSILSISGGDGMVLHYASRSTAASLYRADRDLGAGARSLLSIAPERIARWLPFRWSTDEITQWLLNRAIRPQLRPDATTDLVVTSAVAAEMLAEMVQEAGFSTELDVDLIAVGPDIVPSDPGLALLSVLDGIQPSPADGLVTIALDAEGIMAGAGTVALEDPAFAGEVIEQDFLTPLASCLVIKGAGADGALAVRGELTYANGETRRFSVPFGNIQLIPLNEGEAATLSITPEPGFAVGSHPAGERVQFDENHQIFGGKLGVVVDARGRPVSLPDDPEARVGRLRGWFSDLGSSFE